MARTKVEMADLDQPPEGKFICIKNTTRSTVGIGVLECKGTDIVVPMLCEAVVDPSWTKNRNLRTLIKKGWVTVSWVDEWHEPFKVPTIEEVPADIRPDNRIEEQFAFQIAYDESDDAIEKANTQVRQRGNNQLDLPYMRNKMVKVLATADWLEERVRNRPKVRKAIQMALKKAQAL